MSQEVVDAVLVDEPVGDPPNFDSWYSAIISCVFHFCLMLFVGLITGITAKRDTLPPAVDVVHVAEATSSGGDSFDDPAGDGLEMSEESPEQMTPQALASSPEKISEIEPLDLPEVAISTTESQTNIREQVAKTQAAAAAAKAAAAKTLNENLGGGSAGGGGSGGGRAGRAARWVLQFNTSAASEYLAQLGGLKAEVAFPQQGDSYLYFSNLDGSPTSATRDLSSESRIYWMDSDPRSYRSVAAQLQVPSPPFMVAFLPAMLEEKMLKLEKAYKGVQDEDKIAQTVFECVRRGGGFDVIVVDQRLRGE